MQQVLEVPVVLEASTTELEEPQDAQEALQQEQVQEELVEVPVGGLVQVLEELEEGLEGSSEGQATTPWLLDLEVLLGFGTSSKGLQA